MKQFDINNKKQICLINSLKKKYINLSFKDRKTVVFALKQKKFNNKEIMQITNIPSTSLYRLLND